MELNEVIPSPASAASLPLLELDILRSFVVIAETGNFGRAAEIVGRTPSAVSMQIKKLEDILGRAVFIREPRVVSLTPDGELLLGYARRLLAINREAVSKFITPELSGVVRVGATDDVGERVLPSVLKRFSETHPGITIDVTIDQSSSNRRRLEEGHLDIALISCVVQTVPSGSELVFEERLVWAGARGGGAHLQRPLPVSMWEESCPWRMRATEALDGAGLDYRVAFKSGHIAAQRSAVVADLAVAPLPLSFLADRSSSLCEVAGLPELGSYNIAMMIKDGAEPAMSAAAEHISAVFAQLNSDRRGKAKSRAA